MAITVRPDRVILTGVSYVEASFEASWVDVSVFAEVSFPDVISVEVITPSDRPYLNPAKVFFDGFFANTDFSTKQFAKGSFETLSTADLIEILIVVTRTFSDSFSGLDAVSIDFFNKALADSFSTSDALNRSVEKPLQDTAVLSPLYSAHVEKVAMGVVSDYTLPYPEPPYFAQNYVGGQQGDIVSTSDTFTSQRIYGRFPVESLVSSDAGVVVMQDYANLTYFMEDYVGVGRTF